MQTVSGLPDFEDILYMRFTITSQGTDRHLKLDICGYHLEVSDVDTGSISVYI
ncbi:MAG: hypothetical protein ACYDG2_20155 [Ruminiclostridium sp.]